MPELSAKDQAEIAEMEKFCDDLLEGKPVSDETFMRMLSLASGVSQKPTSAPRQPQKKIRRGIGSH